MAVGDSVNRRLTRHGRCFGAIALGGKRMKLSRVALVFVAAAIATPAYADSFVRFRVKEYEGWVEDTGSSIRVRIIPFVLGPDTNPPAPAGFYNFSTPAGQDAPRLRIMADGRVMLPFKIISSGGMSQDVWPAISASTGIPAARLMSAQVGMVRATFNTATLKVGGVVIAEENLGGGTIGGDPEFAFYLPADRPDLIEAVRNDDYQISLDYQHDLADVRSLSLDMTVSQVSSMWVNAFREVVRNKSSSGGRFLFFNFSSKVSSSRVKESMNSGAQESGLTDINIVMRDPTPEMESRVNQVLGFAQTTRAEMLARHQAAYATALAAGNPKLADAHEKYIEALGPDAPTDNGAALQAALSKLTDAEGLQFLAAGFQTSESSSSSYYRYDYSMAASAKTEAKTSYREYLISNSLVKSRYIASKTPGAMRGALALAMQEMISTVFPSAVAGQPLNQAQWLQGVLGAIESRNVNALRLALNPDIRDNVVGLDIDAPVDQWGNRLIHRAARASGGLAMVQLLLRNGASPNVKNNVGDVAADSADDAGETETASYLNTETMRSGSFLVDLTATGAISLQLAANTLKPAEGSAPQISVTGQSRRRVEFTGYPRLTHFSGLARISFSVAGYCSQLGFYALVQQTNMGCNVVQDVSFDAPVRIRENSQTRRQGEFVYRGAAAGYQFVGLTEVP